MSLAVAVTGWLAALVAGAVTVLLARERAQRREATARAAHELRGPLQAIALITGPSAHARTIALELERARQALDELQAPARRGIARRVAQAPRARLSACQLLEDARAAGLARADSAGTPMRVEWEGPDVAIWGSAPRLGQALANLIENALEHGAGPIDVRGSFTGMSVRFEVYDRGAGLPAPVSELARRARAGRGRRGRGLAIAQEIARAHGGRLASAPSPHGARIVLELPACGGVEAAAPSAG